MIEHLHVKMTAEDKRLLAAVRQHLCCDSDSQAVRMLIRAEARRGGIACAADDAMPGPGRPPADGVQTLEKTPTKKGKRC